MLNITGDLPETQAHPLPEDLREWFGERAVVQLTLEAVCQANLGSRAGLLGSDLLTLLCYCYARGLLGSRQIEWVLTHDPTIRRLCGNTFPDWNAVRNFRRRHRDCLLRTLQRLFASAYELRFGWAPSDSAPVGGMAPDSNAAGQSWLVGLREAATRIERAVRADSMAMDE